jgi:hypothetical protein
MPQRLIRALKRHVIFVTQPIAGTLRIGVASTGSRPKSKGSIGIQAVLPFQIIFRAVC